MQKARLLCITDKYEGYRRRIRTLEYQKHELEKKLESIDYTVFEEVK